MPNNNQKPLLNPDLSDTGGSAPTDAASHQSDSLALSESKHFLAGLTAEEIQQVLDSLDSRQPAAQVLKTRRRTFSGVSQAVQLTPEIQQSKTAPNQANLDGNRTSPPPFLPKTDKKNSVPVVEKKPVPKTIEPLPVDIFAHPLFGEEQQSSAADANFVIPSLSEHPDFAPTAKNSTQGPTFSQSEEGSLLSLLPDLTEAMAGQALYLKFVDNGDGRMRMDGVQGSNNSTPEISLPGISTIEDYVNANPMLQKFFSVGDEVQIGNWKLKVVDVFVSTDGKRRYLLAANSGSAPMSMTGSHTVIVKRMNNASE